MALPLYLVIRHDIAHCHVTLEEENFLEKNIIIETRVITHQSLTIIFHERQQSQLYLFDYFIENSDLSSNKLLTEHGIQFDVVKIHLRFDSVNSYNGRIGKLFNSLLFARYFFNIYFSLRFCCKLRRSPIVYDYMYCLPFICQS